VISSNTSTIPLARLIEGHTKTFGESFVITHFFNPPRVMPLVEVVSGPAIQGCSTLSTESLMQQVSRIEARRAMEDSVG
jgi:3-hydroxyacyl-CoA dehydrogenase